MKKEFIMKLNITAGFALAALIGFTGCSNQSDTQSVDTTTSTSDQEVTTLRLSHFWTNTSAMNNELLEPWAKKIKEESGGRLVVEIYPSGTLSKPDATYNAIAKGTIDAGIHVQGYTAGRFPLTQVTELPGLSNSASQMSCILQTLYDDGDISSEYEDTHPIFMIGTGPSVLHTINKPIRKPDDMKGMRIRHPSDIAANIIEKAGASPVGLPASDLYTSLQRGVIDGMSLPWSPTGSFNLIEVVKYHTNIPIYSSSLLLTMNKDKYEGLPADLKKVIDNNSGMPMALISGEIFVGEDGRSLDDAKAKGNTIIDIPDPFSDPEWDKVLQEATQKYIDDVDALGLDGSGVYEKAKAASAACKV